MFTVRQARLMSGNTQQDLANLLGISVHSYRRIEKRPGTATIQFARNFSRVIKLPIDKIFFGRHSTYRRYREK